MPSLGGNLDLKSIKPDKLGRLIVKVFSDFKLVGLLALLVVILYNGAYDFVFRQGWDKITKLGTDIDGSKQSLSAKQAEQQQFQNLVSEVQELSTKVIVLETNQSPLIVAGNEVQKVTNLAKGIAPASGIINEGDPNPAIDLMGGLAEPNLNSGANSGANNQVWGGAYPQMAPPAPPVPSTPKSKVPTPTSPAPTSTAQNSPGPAAGNNPNTPAPPSGAGNQPSMPAIPGFGAPEVNPDQPLPAPHNKRIFVSNRQVSVEEKPILENRTELPPVSLTRFQYEIIVQGTYISLADFLNKLVNSDTLVLIDKIQIKPPAVPSTDAPPENDDFVLLELTMNYSIFLYNPATQPAPAAPPAQ